MISKYIESNKLQSQTEYFEKYNFFTMEGRICSVQLIQFQLIGEKSWKIIIKKIDPNNISNIKHFR